MKYLFRFILSLSSIFLLLLNLSSKLYATDCGCDTTGAYVDPASGVAPDLILSTVTTAYSPNSIYEIVTGSSGGQTVLNIYKVDGNQLLFQLTFSGNAHWGFSPDDHRFAFWSMANQTQQTVKLYNLEGSSPGTPVLNEAYSTGQGNEASVTFSPNGNYFVYALITGTNSTYFMVADSKTGEIKFDANFNYSTAPGLSGDTYGGATWGFGPDTTDHTLMLAWLTSGTQQLQWQLLNLSLPAGSTVVYNPSPYSVTSAYWAFSLCGDVIASVSQISSNVDLRLIKTTDGTSSSLYSYGNVSILLRTTATQHQVQIGTNAFTDLNPAYPNTAALPCGTTDVTPPSWPADKALTASSITETSVQLDWTSASSDAAKYKIFEDDAPLDSVPSTTNSYLVNGLRSGTTYHFKVEAADTAGNYSTDGPATDVTTLSADTIAPVWPDTTVFKVHMYSSGSVKLYWTKATDNIGVKSYRTYLNDTLYNEFSADTVSTFYYQYLSGLVTGKKYTINVVAVDDSGNVSTNGPSRTITFNPDTVPQWPNNAVLKATDIGVTTAKLSWTTPAYDFAIVGYNVCSDANNCNYLYAQDDLHNTDTTFSLQNLYPDSTYTFYVIAYGDNNIYSDKGPQVTFRTLPDLEPPTWPSGSSLSACETGTDYVLLRWDPATDNVGVTNYRIYQNNKLITTIENPDLGAITYKVTGLQPAVTYAYRIDAGDRSGNHSSQSLSATAQTLKSAVGNPAFPNTSYKYKLISGKGANLVDLNDSGHLVGFDSNTGLGFIWENDSTIYMGTTGMSDVNPYFINNEGDVAGEALIMSTGDYMPFFWRNDTIRGIGSIVQLANWTVPTAMNDSGEVVGWSRYASIFSAGFQIAFSWTPTTTTMGVDLGTLGGDKYMLPGARVESEATDVNNKGQIVGYTLAAVDSQAVRHGFIWENGQMKDLDSTRFLYPIAINDNGEVLVTDGQTATSQLMVWHNSRTTETIGTLGGPQSFGQGITENGYVYGSSQTDHISCDGSYAEHAFIWDGANIIDLGTMGGENSMALDMNSKGQVVGEAELFNGKKHAFLWQNGVMIDLNPAGYDESSAVKINESGQVLINAYIDHDTVDEETGQITTVQFEYGLLASPVTVPNINITSADTVHFCPGASFNVNYTVSNGTFEADNKFVIQLSDPKMGLLAPMSVQAKKLSDGVLQGTLPIPFKWSNVDSSSFKIRIISSDPVSISNEFVVNTRFGNCSSYAIIGSIGNVYCAGDSLDIPFTVAGSNFAPGNTFTAMLSDSSGDFNNGTVIGTLQDTATGIIPAMIPGDIPAGHSYRIRIEASVPGFVSQDNGFNLTINQAPTAEISQNGDSLTASEGDAWIWIRNGDTLNTEARSIQVTQDGNYRVIVFRDGCSALSNPLSFVVGGISENYLVSGIRILPNPSTGIIRIDAAGQKEAGELTISVYDITGELISQTNWSKINNEKTYTLDLSDQPDGLYFINIIIPNKGVCVKKVIIRH